MAAAASLEINNVPAAVIQELLTKYKFIPTSAGAEASQRNGHSFTWQEKDPHFRQLPVECTGFTANDGRVYVCGDILSLLSGVLKLKIERNQPIKFDCSSETFDTVMKFAHSTNGTRPTRAFLLQLLPKLHECKLPFLSAICACAIACIGSYTLTDLLMTAFRAENEELLECCLRSINSRRTLLHVMDTCNAFRDVRKTSFAGEALGRMIELLKTLSEKAAAAPVEDSGVGGVHSPFVDAKFLNQVRKLTRPYLSRFNESPPTLDFPLVVGKEKFFISRPVLAQTSGFFHQLFYGDFAEQVLTSLAVENATAAELKCLLTLVFPTLRGIWWRLTPIACDGERSMAPQSLLDSLYKSEHTFGGDPFKFVNVFKLAEYYQITGLVAYLTDVAVHCLPWRQRLQLADLFKSREIMASLLTDDSLMELKKEMAASANALDEFSSPTHQLIIEFFLHATNL